MKFIVIAVLLAEFVLRSSLSHASSHGLSFVTLDNFQPYSWTSDQGARGIDVEIIRELSRRINIPISISFVPWKRVLLMTKTGKTDGSFAAFKTSERNEFAIYIDPPMHYSTYKLFVRKGSGFRYTKLDDLYGKIIAKNAGFLISAPIDQAIAENKIRVIEGKNANNNIRLVVSGRADAFVGNENEIMYQLKQMKLTDEIIPLPRPLRVSRGAFLMISKAADIVDKQLIVQKISKTLSEMKRDGSFEKIYEQYLR